MHRLACEYGKGLHMHNLDANDSVLTATDDDRRGMWELIHIDMFYHMLYNKPATMSLSPDSWRVNLPWLAQDSLPSGGDTAMAVRFMIRGRLTFLFMECFQILDRLDDKSHAIEAIMPLFDTIEALFDDWKIVRCSLQSN
jgi:hypothetical protein